MLEKSPKITIGSQENNRLPNNTIQSSFQSRNDQAQIFLLWTHYEKIQHCKESFDGEKSRGKRGKGNDQQQGKQIQIQW